MRGVLGSEVGRNGGGGRIFDRGASWVSTERGVWYRRRRIGFGRMAWVVGSGQRVQGARHDTVQSGIVCSCDRHERAEEGTDRFEGVNADRAEPVVSVCRWRWSGRSRNRRGDARRVERGGTGLTESRHVGDHGSTDAAVGADSIGVGARRSYCGAAHCDAESVCFWFWRDVECHGRDSLTPAVGISKRKVCASARRGRKIVLDCRAHCARWRDATDDIAANTCVTLSVVGKHVWHKHALNLISGRGVRRRWHVHIGRVGRRALGGGQ